MKRRVAAVLIGAWLMGTMVMWWVAAENFRTVDRVLSGQRAYGLEQRMEKLTGGDARVLFRHLASELNRYYFRVWNWVQIVLGVTILGLLSTDKERDGVSQVAMLLSLLIVFVFFIYLTPTITALGRSLDFVPREPYPPALSRFWSLHVLYTVLDVIKFALVLLVGICLVRAGAPLRPQHLFKT